MKIRLDPGEQPATVDLEFTDGKDKGYKNYAIYRLDGDALKLRMNDKFGGNSSNERPANFSTAEGKEAVLFILKRVRGGDTRPAKGPAPRAQAEPKTDKDRLQGTWVAVSINARGKDVPAEQAGTFRITFAGDRMKTHRLLEDAKEIPYRLDPEQTPKAIDFQPVPGPGLGIYAFDGDKLLLCITEGGALRPTDFKPGEGRTVVVLKRADVPAKGEKEADLKSQIKSLRETLKQLITENQAQREALDNVQRSNVILKRELQLLNLAAEKEARKDEIRGVLSKRDAGNNTVSLTLGRTKLALNGVPLSVRAKFFLGPRECTINDLKPGMAITLRLENSGDRSEVVRIEAGPAGKE
jgi:uncharacterized protein (TIGR03067 family)